jgi:acetyltransferase-like isoleucine patch superfamily enzyme
VHNPFDPGYYRSDELRSMGFARVGEGSAIARNCTIIGLENITIGDFVRIDGYSSIIATSGHVRIGSRVHICSSCMLAARAGIEMGDYSSLSHGVRVLTAVDDFSGAHMTNSTLPSQVLGVHSAPIKIGRYVPIGTGAIVFPGVTIGEGAAVSALSAVSLSLPEWMICGGNPAQPTGPRSRKLLQLEAAMQSREYPT